MLNILAWCDVRKKFCITVDSDEVAYIKIHLSLMKVIYFEEVLSSLYIFKQQPHQVDQKLIGYPFLTLAATNMSHFNKNEIDRAE